MLAEAVNPSLSSYSMALHFLQGRVTVGRGTKAAGQGTWHLAKDQRIRWQAKFHQLPKNTSRLRNQGPWLPVLPTLMDTGCKSTGVSTSCYWCSQERGVPDSQEYQEGNKTSCLCKKPNMTKALAFVLSIWPPGSIWFSSWNTPSGKGNLWLRYYMTYA